MFERRLYYHIDWALVVAIFADKNAAKWMAAGLAVFAGAFLVSDLGPGLRRRL